jgi:hypothetical protein
VRSHYVRRPSRVPVRVGDLIGGSEKQWASWEEGRPGNICGQARGLTTIAALRGCWAALLRLGFFIGSLRGIRQPVLLFFETKLLKLSFLHFARWGLVRAFPTAGRPNKTRLPSTYLMFESHFNGDFDTYIDAFCDVLALRLWYFWRGGYGYPKVNPSDRFKNYITDQEHVAELDLSAYPEATATTIVSALNIGERLKMFARETATLDPESFAQRYRRLLTEVQRSL